MKAKLYKEAIASFTDALNFLVSFAVFSSFVILISRQD